MALFGYPVAQENDAERAVRAALAIQRALVELNRKNVDAGKPALNARIGLETGPVVVDSAGEIFGDAPNIAARVQALAEPGPVKLLRSPSMRFLPEPEGGSLIEELRMFVNARSDDDFTLVVAWLVAALRSVVPTHSSSPADIPRSGGPR